VSARGCPSAIVGCGGVKERAYSHLGLHLYALPHGVKFFLVVYGMQRDRFFCGIWENVVMMSMP
jgi:hypothetical protein